MKSNKKGAVDPDEPIIVVRGEHAIVLHEGLRLDSDDNEVFEIAPDADDVIIVFPAKEGPDEES